MAPPYKDSEKRKEAQRKSQAKRRANMSAEQKERELERNREYWKTYDDDSTERVRKHRKKLATLDSESKPENYGCENDNPG